VDERLPERSQQATLQALGDEEVRELVEAYIDAWSRRDVEAIAALLAEDAVFSMPPWHKWWQGRERIASLRRTRKASRRERSRSAPTGRRRSPSYSLDEETGQYAPAAIGVLTLEGGLIKEITAFVTPEIFFTLRSPSGARALTGSS
jgi:RNA polymerase sigma-70 factor (ECF subfamily)